VYVLKTKRLDLIEEYIVERGSVSLDELVEKFNVSKNTIRRDVNDLVEGGEFKKVYGGVSVNKSTYSVPNVDRQIRNHRQKQQIAKVASEFVQNGDIIFIDSGSTTVEMVEFIKNKELTIITNNVDFIIKALPYNNLSIFSTGGMLERTKNSFTRAENNELITSYNITKAFLASTGVTIKNGVTNSLPLESGLKSTVVQESAENFLLVDSSKFDKVALTTYCQLNEINHLISDSIPDKYIRYAKENNIEVVVTEK